MALSYKPFRSVLYVPGSRQKAMSKARDLPTDAVILDLEDAVLAAEKDNARNAVSEVMKAGFGNRTTILRINSLSSEWGEWDAKCALQIGVDGVCLPKAESAQDIDRLADITGDLPIWAMIETPLGVLNAAEIAAHPKLQGVIVGSNDLLKDLGARARPDRLPLIASLSQTVLAARAYGKIAIDAVFNAYRDLEGLRLEVEQGRDLGFDGKTLVHPDQLPIANEIFGPSADELHLAQRKIVAFEMAKSQGQGVAVLDGKIVEDLHVAEAQRQIDMAKAIAVIEESWHM